MCTAPELTAAGGAWSAALAAHPERALVALDYDGTLAPIVVDPSRAHPQPGAREALGAAAAVFGTVAIVSGRAALGVVELLDLAAPDAPAVAVVGVHGRQMWSRAAGLQPAAPHPGLASAGAGLGRLLAGLAPGVRIEDKGHSLAIHFRACADPQVASAAAREPVVRLAEGCGLEVLSGRLVLELLGPGPDKGVAFRELAAGAQAVCFIGDDLADLAAFTAIDALRKEGVPGLKVAVANPESSAPAAAADLVLEDPAAVVEWLLTITAVASRGG
ncbi:MAG TPA: trehalose-phosphatase [Sporichthyaceae bacterium]|jgi:trehalose 6-phosphate phosphatase|nr:trehalose-phosphatase [Sporichthyaceae bacterium]